jgi:hypothetical protein
MPGVILSLATKASPLCRMVWAIWVKSPFSHKALFGFTAGVGAEDCCSFADWFMALVFKMNNQFSFQRQTEGKKGKCVRGYNHKTDSVLRFLHSWLLWGGFLE